MGLDDLLKEIEAKDPVLAKKLASEIDTRRLEAIRNLAGCVGHAFNNILAAVIGYAGLLSESPQSEEDKDSVKNILLSGARGARLVQGIMSYAQKTLRRESRVDMHCLIEEKVRSIAYPDGLSMKTRLSADRSFVLGDRDELGRAVESLLQNAVEAVVSPGLVEVLTSSSIRDSSDGLPRGAYLAVSFADSGCGLSKDVIDHLYEPGFTTKELATHLGMGLASAYGCVQSHNGAIVCCSEVGKGSTFTMYLPLSDEIRRSAAPDGSGAVHSKNILVVDDEPAVRDMICRMLGKLGYRARPITDLTEVVGIYKGAISNGSPIDLIVVDVSTSDHCRSLKDIISIDPGARFLICSGYTDGLQDGLLTGPNVVGRLEKPFSVSDLESVLSRLYSNDKR
ncbi:MAG: ATP-binding protein [Nanoarchaeota archaeon]